MDWMESITETQRKKTQRGGLKKQFFREAPRYE